MTVTEWQARAACKGMDVAIFYPDGNELRGRQYKEAKSRALLVCSRCPVQDDCRQWAFDNNETLGILGGLTESQRRDAHWRTLTNRKPPECGTDRGYSPHRRLGQQPCTPCVHAHSRANAGRRDMQRRGAA